MDCAKIPNGADKKQKNDLCPVQSGRYRLEKENTICNLFDKNYKLEFNLQDRCTAASARVESAPSAERGKRRVFAFTGAGKRGTFERMRAPLLFSMPEKRKGGRSAFLFAGVGTFIFRESAALCRPYRAAGRRESSRCRRPGGCFPGKRSACGAAPRRCCSGCGRDSSCRRRP